jgi:hypothetical protein
MMTMKEVEYRTPNGLHDAYLLGLSVDYVKQTLTLDLNWAACLHDGTNREERCVYKQGQLIIRGLKYCVIEAPDGEMDQINGFETKAEDIERMRLPDVGSDVFRYSIFVLGWYSSIHFAGDHAEVVPADLIVRGMGQ